MDPSAPKPRVLVVDDEPSFLSFVGDALSALGYPVAVAARPSEALKRAAESAFEVAVLDLNLPEMGGLELARRLRALSPDLQVIILTGNPELETAIEGIQEGVFDYLQKGNIKVARLDKSVYEAGEKRRLERENRELLRRLAESNRLLTALHGMSTALAGERYLDRVTAGVVEAARSLLGSDVVRLLLFQRGPSGEMLVEAGVGDGAEALRGMRLNPYEGIATIVAQRDEAVMLEVASAHASYSGRLDRATTDLPGYCCVPVRHTSVLGALLVAGRPNMGPEHRDLLATLARQAGVAIENALYHDRSLNFFTHTSELLVSFLEKMEPHFAGHSRGTAVLADMLSRRAGLGDADRRSVHFGALLHDIGKTRLPAELLTTDKPLSLEQRDVVRQHAAFGLEMLRPITLFQDILPIVHAHHERWDGTGYPLGLKAEDIPLGARIVAIAESFDAMTLRVPQERRRTPVDALVEIDACSGSQFDPQLVRLFVVEYRHRDDPRSGRR